MSKELIMERPKYNYFIIPGLMAKSPQTAMTPDVITSIVCDALGINVSDVLGKNRRHDICFARHLSIHFTVKYAFPKMFKTTIGTWFNRDHASVIHANRNIQNMVDTDPNVKKTYNHLQYKINEYAG